MTRPSEDRDVLLSVTWNGCDLSEQREQQLQGGGLVLPGAVGHGGGELLQQ